MGNAIEAEQGHSFRDASVEYGGVDGRVCLRLVLPFYHRSWTCRSIEVHRSLTFVCCSLHLHPNAFDRCTGSSTESQRALLWRDGYSRRSSIACSLAAGSQDPRRNHSAWTARALLTLPSSPQIFFFYPLHPAVAITRPHQGCHMGRLHPPPTL